MRLPLPLNTTTHKRHARPPLIFFTALSLLLLQLSGRHTVSVTPRLPITCLGNLTATQQREGHDLTSPTGPPCVRDLFILPCRHCRTSRRPGEQRVEERSNVYGGKFLLKARKQRTLDLRKLAVVCKYKTIAHFVLQIENVPTKQAHCAAETNAVCLTRAKKKNIPWNHSRTEALKWKKREKKWQVPIKYVLNAK